LVVTGHYTHGERIPVNLAIPGQKAAFGKFQFLAPATSRDPKQEI